MLRQRVCSFPGPPESSSCQSAALAVPTEWFVDICSTTVPPMEFWSKYPTFWRRILETLSASKEFHELPRNTHITSIDWPIFSSKSSWRSRRKCRFFFLEISCNTLPFQLHKRCSAAVLPRSFPEIVKGDGLRSKGFLCPKMQAMGYTFPDRSCAFFSQFLLVSFGWLKIFLEGGLWLETGTEPMAPF